eukprot:1184891-Prymnesium_polylepis.1
MVKPALGLGECARLLWYYSASHCVAELGSTYTGVAHTPRRWSGAPRLGHRGGGARRANRQ